MIDAKLLAEFSLRRGQNADQANWHVIADHKIGETITEATLRDYVQRVLSEGKSA